jgi:hypothetical protein
MRSPARNADTLVLVVGGNLVFREHCLGHSAGRFMCVRFGEAHANLEPGSPEDATQRIHRR